jgi:hypothetical protein
MLASVARSGYDMCCDESGLQYYRELKAHHDEHKEQHRCVIAMLPTVIAFIP